MDARLRDLVESELVARSVPAGMRPEFVARMRATDRPATVSDAPTRAVFTAWRTASHVARVSPMQVTCHERSESESGQPSDPSKAWSSR